MDYLVGPTAPAELSGRYSEGSVVNGRPSYVKGAYSIYWDGAQWCLGDGNTVYYYVPNDTETPPEGRWLGGASAPYVMRASTFVSPATGALLRVLRTVLGPVLLAEFSDGTIREVEWQWIVEGPPYVWIAHQAGLPALILSPEGAAFTAEGSRIRVVEEVVIYVVVKSPMTHSGLPDSRAFEYVREVGEAVVHRVMSQGARLGTTWIADRRLINAGVEHDLCIELSDKGILVYAIRIEFEYTEPEVFEGA